MSARSVVEAKRPSVLKTRGSVVMLEKGRRPGQEDYVLESNDRGIFAVADGFGGPEPGAAAARVACEEVRHFLLKEAGDLDATLPFVLRKYYSLAGNVLFNALVHANRKVIALNRDKSIHEKGGASVIAGFLDGDLLALANVGGCSAWLIRDRKLTELVTPRTYGRLANPFGPSEAETEAGRDDRAAPLMALGMTDDLEPEISEYRIHPGDWLLFQSDGLHPATREELARIQSPGLTSDEINEYLQSLFQARELNDNIAVSLVIF